MALSYATLAREAAWSAEFVTQEMKSATDEIRQGLGLPWANIGFKGDNAHLNGGHRSQRWILTSRYCTSRTYTVQPGLRADLVDAIAAIDITPSSKGQMLLICQRLDAAVRAGLLEEVSAWYGNVNGDQVVDGWDNIRNVVARSDSSHLWHLHITIHRWALRSAEFFRRLVNVLLGRNVAPVPESAPVSAEDEDSMYLIEANGANGVGAYALITADGKCMVRLKSALTGGQDTANLWSRIARHPADNLTAKVWNDTMALFGVVGYRFDADANLQA